jgi:excisionase family DNA binding protein
MKSTEQSARRVVRVTEVAHQLSMSRSAIYGLMEKGLLPFVKIGKSRRVPLDAVEKLVREGTGEASP